MAIVVKHQGDILAQIIANAQKSAYAQNANASTNPDADVNPFTMSKAKGAQAAASLEADREGLAKKQQARYGDRKDSYAGFDWLTPIGIKGHTDAQGRPLNDTIYRRDGPDPLASGAWGSLGSAEHVINDPTNQINIQDPRERAMVEKVSRSGAQGLVDDDIFKSKEELENDKWKREDDRATAKLKEKALIDDAKSKRDFDEQLRRDELIYGNREKLAQGTEDRRKSREDATSNAEYGAASGSVESQIGGFGREDTWEPAEADGKGYGDPGSGYSWTQSQRQEIESLRNVAAKIQSDKSLNAQSRSEAMKRIAKDLDAIRPVREYIPGETPDQKSARAMQDYEQRKQVDARYRPEKAAKPEFSTGDLKSIYQTAAKALSDEGLPTDSQSVLRKAQEIQDALRQMKGGGDATQFPKEKPAKVRSTADVQSLPSGAHYVSPVTGLVYIKD